MTGKKFDQDKPDLSYIPREALDAMARAFMHGAKKYGPGNYLGGMEWRRLTASAMRHVTDFNEGQDLDPESKHSHLGHGMAALAMLEVYRVRDLGHDNRLKTSKKEPKLDNRPGRIISLKGSLTAHMRKMKETVCQKLEILRRF